MERTYEIKIEKDGRKHLHFFKNPSLGFDFEFDIYIPEDTRMNANLLLSFYDKIDQRRMNRMLDDVQAPIMVTNIENSKNEKGEETIRYKQFEKSALVNKDGTKVGYGTLETSIIEQYKIAITEAYRVLKQMQIIKEDKEEKVDVEGYSAQGVKAQRLAFLIPESIRSAIIGGAISSIPLPVKEINGMALQYPTGTAGLEDIIGKDNIEKWKRDYEELIQIVYATEQELKYDGNYTINGERIKRNEDLTKEEFAYSQISVSQHDISPETANTVKAQVKLWGTDINERISHEEETVNSNGGALKKRKIYKGVGHHFFERGDEGLSEWLGDFTDAIVSMDRGQEIRGFERWRG